MPAHPLLRNTLLALLERDGPQNIHELAYATGRDSRTVDGCLRSAHALRLVHIQSWQRNLVIKGKPRHVWAAGPGRDAPRPKPLSRSEVNRRYDDRWAVLRSRRRAAKRGSQVLAWVEGQRVRAGRRSARPSSGSRSAAATGRGAR